MYEQIEKSKENNSRAVANSVAQKQSGVKQGFGFVDNRPEVIQRVGPVTTGNLTTSADHIKGNPKGTTKARRGKPGKTRTQSSEEVIKRAQGLIESGKAKFIERLENDDVYEVPRKNPKSEKEPRLFHVHLGGGDGKSYGFFEVPNKQRGANVSHEFSDSEDEGLDERGELMGLLHEIRAELIDISTGDSYETYGELGAVEHKIQNFTKKMKSDLPMLDVGGIIHQLNKDDMAAHDQKRIDQDGRKTEEREGILSKVYQDDFKKILMESLMRMEALLN